MKKLISTFQMPLTFDFFKGFNQIVKQVKLERPSELHARDRYAVADQIMAERVKAVAVSTNPKY